MAELETEWNRIYSVTEQDLLDMKEEVVISFDKTFANYMRMAFPMDDLRPITCKGSNSEGGMGLTLLDSLDTLIVMNRSRELSDAVQLIKKHVDFDLDHLASVFEVTIRAIGGLLSAHMLIQRNPSLVKDYDDSLLKAAADLGERLLPAFEYTNSIPTSRINFSRAREFI